MMGLELSLACWNAGAKDWRGTMVEEIFSKAAGATFGEYVSPEEFRAMIWSIGRIPAERTTTYRIRRTFEDEVKNGTGAPGRLRLAPAEKHVVYAEGSY